MFRFLPDGMQNRSGAARARFGAAAKIRAERLARAVACIELMERRQLFSGAALVLAPEINFITGVKSSPVEIVAADVNGDGKTDLVVESANGDISILIGTGAGTFKSPQIVYDQLNTTAVAGPQSLAVAVVDGKPAIFASSQNSTRVAVLTASSSGVFSVYSGAAASNVSNHHLINGLTVANISGTSFLVTANADGSISTSKIKTGTLGFVGFTGTAVQINSVISGSPAVESLALGNFITGGKGHDLVVLGSNGMAAVLPGTTNGFSATPTAISALTNGQALFNAGTSNLVVLNTDGTITPLKGQQSSTVAMAFVNGGTIAAPFSGTEMLVTGDINGDGKPDFLASNGSGTFALFTGSSPAAYSLSGTYYNAGTQFKKYAIASANLTGDGLADIITSYYTPSSNTSAVAGVSRNATPTVPAITSAASAAATVGAAFSFTVTTTAFPLAKIAFSGAMPPGVTFKDNGNGTATFTAGLIRPVTKAVFSGTITAANTHGSTNQSFSFNLVQAATFTSPTTLTVKNGASVSFTVKSHNGFSGGGFTHLTATLGGNTISASTFVDGLTFTDLNNGSATLTGTPTSSGALTLLVTAGAATQTVQLSILGPPNFGAISNSFTFVVGSNATTGAIALTVPGTPIAKIQDRGGFTPNLATGLRFTDNGNGTFTISGDPSKGTGGTYIGHLYAVNNQGPASDQPFTFTVNVTQPAVYTSAGSATFTVGKAANFTVRANGFPIPSFLGGASTTSSALPAGLTFTGASNGTATITGMPAVGTGGKYIINLSDSAGDTQAFTLTIKETPSFVAGNTVTVAHGSSVNQTIFMNGFGFPLAFSGGIQNLPSGMTLTLNQTGTSLILAGTAPSAVTTTDILFKLRNSDGSLSADLTLELVTT